ncbi:calcium-binding protein [Rhizobium mongolense]|uniref:Nodulation protein n=1 Tax=Rhizobium mongolense TaxID=57676 RepID=A0ABR6J114_9HYPH|nr:calcium-binding protein [Rhizobium mongolense]MBB4233359.1 putative nodulation protein [Rhizobium mongolense]
MGPGDNIFAGGSGSDLIWGGGGDDWIFAGPGNDKVLGGDGNDTIYGNYSYSSSRGLKGDDDQLIGGPGNDHLITGDGADTLTGGPGRDRFEFSFNDPMSGSVHVVTVVTDFDPTEDEIVLDLFDFDRFDRPPSEQGTVGNFINRRSPIVFTDQGFTSASEAAKAAPQEVRGDILVYYDAMAGGAVLASVDGENTAHEFAHLDNLTMADVASLTSNHFEYS